MEVNGNVGSRIPRLVRSSSFHGRGLQKQVVEEDQAEEALDDVGSLSSVCSVVSCATPGSAYRSAVNAARGVRTTKSSRYALHCCSSPSSQFGSEDYLTPTQRANRTIRQLKALLKESQAECSYKDFEIQRLTRELVALRMKQAEKPDSSGGATAEVESTNTATPSLADSGLFDDLVNHSKESLTDKDVEVTHPNWAAEKRKLVAAHLEETEQLKKQHATEVQNIKTRFTDRLESALSQLSESNTRYAALLSSVDLDRGELKRTENQLSQAREQIFELERAVAKLQFDIESRKADCSRTENESAKLETLNRELNEKDQLITLLQSKLEKLSQPEDLSIKSTTNACDDGIDSKTLEEVASQHQRQESLDETDTRQCNQISTKSPLADATITLQFLRSAVFYLLTDSENWNGHLAAVQSILEFSPEERLAVERAGKHYL